MALTRVVVGFGAGVIVGVLAPPLWVALLALVCWLLVLGCSLCVVSSHPTPTPEGSAR